jgi:Flp pilus assembly protein CpaB
LKRSNRLVLLIGVFLAIVAFVGVLILFQQGGGGGGGGRVEERTTVDVVIAASDIPLGSKITADMLTTEKRDKADQPPDGYSVPSDVIGQTARQSVTQGQYISTAILSGDSGSIANIEVPAGKVAMAIQVDQVSGVGTITKAGDHVDMLIGLTGDKFPVVTLDAETNSVSVVSGLNSTSVKLLLQGMQVLGTLLPPPPQDTGNNAEGEDTGQPDTALTGQQQIVIVAVDAQQAEVIKYAQIEGSISLVLRSADDFRDPETGLPLDPNLIVPVTTAGITLKSLVDDYGVLVPQLVEAILPAQAANP